ncbi:MAG TPA: DNA repair protein RecN [Propionibacteriaceae bacterium]|nr:DNA repair protein RecN [Propionibacteriaceae bacterium]
MLTGLRISALGVIDETSLELGPGLVAITGETGAGKTMVVSGLGLLLGGRADAGIVRRGAPRAVVEGRFTGAGRVAEVVAELGGVLEDDDPDAELLVARQVTAQGRSRAFAGGVQVTVGALAEITGELATIHGQSEQVRLGTPERQREVLDRYCGPEHLDDLARYARDFARHRDLMTERDTLRREAHARAREIDLLRFGLDEISALEPRPGEDADLLAEATRLQAADELRALASEAVGALSGDSDGAIEVPGARDLVVRAGRALAAAARVDPAAGDLVRRLRETSQQLNDVAADAASYLADLDADPARLEAVMERRSALSALTRKYGDTVDEVLAWAETASLRLVELEGSDERIDELDARVADLGERLLEQAGEIGRRRAEAAERLARAVAAELAELAMPHARLVFDLQPLPDLSATGAERVALLFSANPGAEPAPLGRVASGGELSRVRLALEVVLADSDPGHCFVFDEVDAGVGGAVGLQIGRRLAALARRGQVIVVTHLAQVAAFADQHLVVAKASAEGVTNSGISEVSGEQRLSELARMMAGLETSETALAHARDLLAERDRSSVAAP